ncbi:ABC transporter permease subunit [Namhaeicola litoreus]|uniref:ABC transporter permease subunit n=1 Tax=Namhaeicola litoreus TaxID=1052145 RepID=A0ABW3XZS3_9FLAO
MFLFQVEVQKLFSSFRTYTSLGIAALLMLIIDLGLYNDGKDLFDFLLQSIQENFYIEGNIVNGYLISYLALNTLWVHLPILVVIVTAYIFSGEFEMGTIRTMLTQPIKRKELLLAKIGAMLLFVLLFMLLSGFMALVPSVLFFGLGDVIVFIDGIQFIQESTYLLRYLKALFFGTLGMFAFTCMAMYFAIYFRNTLTAVLLVLGLLIVSTLLQTFVFGFFSHWQPFLFTYHMAKWQLFFVDEVPKSSINQSILFLTLMALFFIVLSFRKFQKMQITE